MFNPAYGWDVVVEKVSLNMQGKGRKAGQEPSRPSKGTTPAPTLSVSQRRRNRQSYRSLASAHRQKKQQFIAGGDRRSISVSDGMCFAV